jgi:hypothetical protein
MATSIKGEESPAKLKRQLVIFLVAIGLLLAVAAWFAHTRLQGNMYPLWDHPRHLAIGVPVAVLAGLHLVAGLSEGGWPFAGRLEGLLCCLPHAPQCTEVL